MAALAMLPWSVGAETDVPPAAPSQTQPDNSAGPKLSPSANEVFKLASSGVSDEVIKAFIANDRVVFNLTPDNIIYMQQHGVSGAISAAMLNHDKAVRDAAYAAATAPNMLPQPMPQTIPQVAPPMAPDNLGAQTDTGYGTPPPDYSTLAQYGNWTYQDGYGWGWQPYVGLDTAYYPWGLLGYGAWGYWPGRGWCWSPRGYGGYGYRGGGYGGYHGYNGYAGYHGGYGYGGSLYRGGNVGGVRSYGGVSGFRGGVSVGGGSAFRGGGSVGGGHAGGGGGGHR